MTNENIKVIDLLKDDGQIWLPNFFQTLEKIKNSNDRLKNNYISLDENYKNYLCFNLLIENDSIIAFSGLHTYSHCPQIGRVMSRLYYVEEVRARHLRGREFPSLATKYMLPYQLEIAKEQGLKQIFLSMHGYGRLRYLQKLAVDLNKHYSHQWTAPTELYNTCKLLSNNTLNEDAQCWQNIIYLNLNSEVVFPLAKKTTDTHLY